MSDPIRRLYCHIKKIRNLNRTVVVLAAFLFFTFLNTTLVFADPLPPDADRRGNNNYITLSNLFGRNATLEIVGGASQQMKAQDLLLHFKGKFNIGPNTDLEWHWDQIAPLDDIDNIVFLHRICDVGTDQRPVEDKCGYVKFPYDYDLYNDVSRVPVAERNTEAKVQEILKRLSSSKIFHFSSNKVVDASVLNRTIFSIEKEDQEVDNFDVITKTELYRVLNSNGQLGATSNPFLVPGNRYQIDLWYCPSNDSQSPTGSTIPSLIGTNDNFRQFGNLCGDGERGFFRIAGAQFTAPSTLTDVNALNTGATTDPNANSNTQTSSGLPGCSMTDGTFGDGTFLGCIARAIYYIIFRPISLFASLMGNLFDFFIGYSVSDETYRTEFIVKGWKVIRDFSNIFFIVIMVWTGLQAVFGIEKYPMKNVVSTLIINAILINFSLFGTRLVIDLSNVFARVFYSRIYVCTGACIDENNDGKFDNLKRGAGGFWPLSEKIVSSFNPQAILGSSILKKQITPQTPGVTDPNLGSATTNQIAAGGRLDENDSEYAGYFIIVSFIGAIIMFAIALMFWKTAFIFVGRIIGLYVAMIFSPFAVLTKGNVPLIGGFTDFSWKKWSDDLSKYAALAPVFVFFLYIIYFFLQSDFMKIDGLTKDGSFLETVLYIAIPMIIIYSLITYGAEIAKQFSGKFGAMVQSKIDGAVGGMGGLLGGGIGLAAGASAFVGRNVLGRGINTFGNMKTGRMLKVDGKDVAETRAMRLASQASDSKLSRMGSNFLKWNKNSSWDPRNIEVKVGDKNYTALGSLNKGVSTLSSAFGAAPQNKVVLKDGISKKLGLGADSKGIEAADKARVSKREGAIESKINLDHVSDAEAKAAWERHISDKALEKAASGAEHEYAKQKSAEYSTLSTDIEKKEGEFKKVLDSMKGLTNEMGKTSTTPERKALIEKELKAKGLELQTIKGDYENLAKKQKAELEKVKAENKDYENSTEYRQALEKKQEEEKKKYNDKYGKIKSGKDLTKAMRAEYAEKLREQSFWMKDGKVRPFMGEILGDTTQLAGLAAIFAGGFVAGPLGLAMGEYIKSMGNIDDKATQNIIDKATKGVKKGTKSGDLLKNVQQLESKLKSAVDTYYGKIHDSIESLSAEAIQEALEAKKIDIDAEITVLEENIKNSTDPAIKKQHIAKKGVKIKEKAHYDKLQEEYKKAKEQLEKHNSEEADKEKKKEDTKKPDEGKDKGDKK